MSRIAVPVGAALEQDPVDGLDRPDVQAAGRLDRDHEPRAGIDLAGEDQPLEVAAREQPGLRVDRRRRDRVRVLAAPSAIAARRAVVDEPAAGDRRRR